MGTHAGREAAPLGVIGCARAGFELVGRNLWLVLFPVGIDLLLWLGPRLSVEPLLQSLAGLLRAQAALDPALSSQVAQLGSLLEQLGQEFSLLSLLSGLPLFTVPSLLAGRAPGLRSPLGGVRVYAMSSVPPVLVWGAVLLAAGLVLGGVFLELLARLVSRSHLPRIGDEGSPEDAAPGAGNGVAYRVRLLRVLAFVGVLLGLGACLLPVWALLLGMAVFVAPFVGFGLWIFSIGLATFVVLHLLFVAHAVLLAGRSLMRAMWESIALIRSQLPSVAGLVLLIGVVRQLLGLVWALPEPDSWLMLVGIIGNACVATGLTATTFVFYGERIPQVLRAARDRRQTTTA